MSLITDALGLRQRRAGKKIARADQLPPFRPMRPQRGLLAGFAGLLLIGLLVYWRGAEAYQWLEHIVLGMPAQMGEVAAAPALPPPEPSPVPETAAVSAPAPVAPTPAGGKTEAAEEKNETVPGGNVAATGTEPAEQKKPATPGLMAGDDLSTINVSLAPTKEEREKIQKIKEAERVREVEDYLRRVQIQGVSEDGEDSRVLIDGQLVGLGEKTPLLDLVLEKVEADQIIFHDTDGKKFIKSY